MKNPARMTVILGAILLVGGVLIWRLSAPRPAEIFPGPAPSASEPTAPTLAEAFSRAKAHKYPNLGDKIEASAPKSTPLPAWVEALYREPTRRPRLAEMTSLSPELEAELIAYYRSLPSITNKLGLAGALAYAGGEASVELLIYSLTCEYAGRRFETVNEGVQLTLLARYLGLAAAHSDRAYQFLVDGLNPAFWSNKITWSVTAALGFDPAGRLPGECIMGLGVSSREDAWQTILVLKDHPDTNYLRKVAPEICGAAYYRAMMAEMGRVKFLDNLWFTGESIHRIGEWWKTPEGKEWYDWMNRAQGLTNIGLP